MVEKREKNDCGTGSLVNFSKYLNYKDKMLCDVVEMEAFHMLLGRLWQYDHEVMHNGRLNTYSFLFNATRIVLLPNKEVETSYSSHNGNITLIYLKRNYKVHWYCLHWWRQCLVTLMGYLLK